MWNYISAAIVPLFIASIVVFGLIRKVNVYDAFVEGARKGVGMTIRVLPFIAAMMIAIGVFRASGAMELLLKLISPVTNFLGIPSEIMPLAFMRPLSGSAALSMLQDLFNVYGPDSFAGRTGSALMGSTETIFYTIALYCGSVGIKNTRYAIKISLIVSILTLLATTYITAALLGR